MALRQRKASPSTSGAQLRKSPTGILGLDEITDGGLPAGRPTLVCGAAGCGKTMLAAEFLVRGAQDFGEPGVFMMFEETAAELAENMLSLGFDLEKLQRQKKIALDFVRVERSEIEETGEYDLEGLFIRLGYAIDSIKAKRVALDTIEALFAGVTNHAILRAELRRLFRWLKDRGVTAVITGERGESSFTRYGLEEYVADCVILLDHRIVNQVSTRRLRVVKYRGSAHGTNEYPFLIGARGISVLPITSLALNHAASRQRVATGIQGLDEMLGGLGVFQGSSVLVSGSPGTGKSSIAASFVDAACARGERAILFAYEESESQLLRNMQSIGIRLERWVRKGLLKIESTRPTLHGLEQHLVHMYNLVSEFAPSVVAVDPISNLTEHTEDAGLKLTLMRLIDFLKTKGTTALFTSLTSDSAAAASSEVGVSSLMDSWLWLNNVAFNGERTRTLQVLKSRGMAHSNQVREFVFSDRGVDLIDVYMFGDQVLTGTARQSHEAQLQASTELRGRDHARRLRDLANRRKALDAQIAALTLEAEERAGEVEFAIAREQMEAEGAQTRARSMSAARSATSNPRSRG
ncbi:KaiC 1 [Rhodoferax koreense]|uniref:non-specific serine/threonine protein kinase n=1 Tax=Rhodoferax koreensis TaxID=1842727 RepID=A0A1P8JXG1_9BURK|nr:circadian clock protein KaiC [Rhodoferax koreense]APW38381.1 KaiC 1 [Rhodoferax koreense]